MLGEGGQGKAQKELKDDVYTDIDEDLRSLQQRSHAPEALQANIRPPQKHCLHRLLSVLGEGGQGKAQKELKADVYTDTHEDLRSLQQRSHVPEALQANIRHPQKHCLHRLLSVLGEGGQGKAQKELKADVYTDTHEDLRSLQQRNHVPEALQANIRHPQKHCLHRLLSVLGEGGQGKAQKELKADVYTDTHEDLRSLQQRNHVPEAQQANIRPPQKHCLHRLLSVLGEGGQGKAQKELKADVYTDIHEDLSSLQQRSHVPFPQH